MTTIKNTNFKKNNTNGNESYGCGLDIINYIYNAFKSSKPLTNEEEHQQWLCMRQGSMQAREKLILANMRYVVDVAMKYTWAYKELEDLIQAGCEGLVKATDSFDASLGYRLISFATWHIENEIKKVAFKKKRELTILDAPYKREDSDGDDTIVDHICDRSSHGTDWNLRYRDKLQELMVRLDEREQGLGLLLNDLHDMLIKGYTTNDFARRHRLNEQQMNRLFAILREEADAPLGTTA